MKQASKIANAVVRRIDVEMAEADIVHLSLLPATASKSEMLELEWAKKRRDSATFQVSLQELVEMLTGSCSSQSVEGSSLPSGTVDLQDLEHAVMVDGRLSEKESAKLFNIVRELKTGTWPDGAPEETED